MHKVLTQIETIGIVPVIAISDAGKAVPLARALLAGGIPCAEITFRTAQGEESIRRITAEAPEMLVGAGTVLSTAQAERAVKAGAKFIVSPGFNPAVVQYCVSNRIPVLPGCVTPSEMETALAYGLEVIKFFPAEAAGGLPYIKAVAAPYAQLKFLPTGGITAHNLGEYLRFTPVIACGGSWMVSPALIDAGDFAKIERLSREAAETVRAAR